MKKKLLKTALPLTLAVAMGTASTGIVVCAKGDSTEKEEVVYANLNYDGSVENVYVVNSFDGGKIVDYGKYSKVQNMTTTDQIVQKGDKITIETKEDKLHYQGDLKNAELPWDISLTYELDGQKVTGDEAAGKSGHLKMNLQIDQNRKGQESFWKGYALQITMAIESELCENLVAEGATIANAGKNKQMTYIVLPGKGADITVEADVQDFQMQAISMNGINLNLNIDFDTSMLTDKLEQIEQAASELDGGAEELKKGAKALGDGSEEIEKGADSLNNGLSELYNGIEKVQKGLDELNKKSEKLTSGSSEVHDALKLISKSLNGLKTNTDDLDLLTDASGKIRDGIDALVGGLETVDAGVDTFYSQLEEGGLSDIEELIEYHEMVLDFISITDTQRAIFEAFENKGGLDGNKTMAGMAAIAKMKELADKNDPEAVSLYEEYLNSEDGLAFVEEYLTQAGSMIIVERLAEADIAYIEGTDQLISGIDAALDEDNKDGLMSGAKTLQEQYALFDEKIGELVTSLKSLIKNMNDLKDGINLLLENYEVLDSGIAAYTEGVAKVTEGYAVLYNGAYKLSEGAAELSEGTKTMAEGALELYEGTETMEMGTSTFWQEVQGAGDKMTDGITDVIDEMTGKTVTTGSFVSEKNENVKSVLFVIKTPVIEEAADAVVEEPVEEELTFWQKILRLFGF